MGPPRPIVAHTRRSLSASASHAQWMVEACTHHSTATATATAAPGVVLCVADGIVRIVVHVAAGEDLGGRLRRGIDRLIGVTAGEDKMRPRQRRRTARALPDSLEPASGTFVWSMRRRSRPSRAPSPGVAISLNSAPLTFNSKRRHCLVWVYPRRATDRPTPRTVSSGKDYLASPNTQPYRPRK